MKIGAMCARIAATIAKTFAMRGIRVAGGIVVRIAVIFARIVVICEKTVATCARIDAIAVTEACRLARAKVSS